MACSAAMKNLSHAANATKKAHKNAWASGESFFAAHVMINKTLITNKFWKFVMSHKM